MKTSLTLLGAGSISLAVYVGTWELDHEPVRLIYDSTTRATSTILAATDSGSNIPPSPHLSRIDTTQPTTISRKNPIPTQVDPHVQRIISGMSWHQSCISGRMNPLECSGYIRRVGEIENILQSTPKIRSRLEYASYWQEYLMGTITPEQIYIYAIEPYQRFEEFARVHPGVAQAFESSPRWRNGVYHNPESVDIDRLQLLGSIQSLQAYLRSQSEILQQIESYGFNETDLYMQDPSSPTSIYAVISDIREIESIYPDTIFRQWLNSDLGKKYRSGQLTPKEARESLEKILMDQNTENS